MNILHLVQAYHPAIGGSEWLTKNLAEQLASRYGDRVTVFTSNAYKTESFWRGKGPFMPAGSEKINGVTVRRFPVFNRLQFVRELLARGAYRLRLPGNDWLRTIQTGPIIPALPKAIAGHGAQIVFATAFPFLHMHYALAGARRARIPVVLLGALHVADKWGYERQIIYRAIQRADAYIAHTTFERDYLIGRGIDAAKISVIGAGVNAGRYAQADGSIVRRRYGWGNKPVIGVIARQSALKRLDLLIAAMPAVWSSYPDAQLLLAGARTSHSPQLEQMIARLSRRSQVTMVNDFDEADKANLIAACDIIAHPSGNESFCIALIEAWAGGKAVIGVRAGAIPSVIAAGQDGLLADYLDAASMAQAIVTLLDNPAQRDKMGENGRKKVERHYTWETVTAKLRRVYERIAAPHKQ